MLSEKTGPLVEILCHISSHLLVEYRMGLQPAGGVLISLAADADEGVTAPHQAKSRVVMAAFVAGIDFDG